MRCSHDILPSGLACIVVKILGLLLKLRSVSCKLALNNGLSRFLGQIYDVGSIIDVFLEFKLKGVLESWCLELDSELRNLITEFHPALSDHLSHGVVSVELVRQHILTRILFNFVSIVQTVHLCDEFAVDFSLLFEPDFVQVSLVLVKV